MRAMPFALACCAAVFGLSIETAARADEAEATPGLIIFDRDQTARAESRPRVLRGQASRRGTVDGRLGGAGGSGGLQIGAGAKLWMTDPATGRVIVCDERRTSRVGGRFIGCLEDQLPYAIDE